MNLVRRPKGQRTATEQSPNKRFNRSGDWRVFCLPRFLAAARLTWSLCGRHDSQAVQPAVNQSLPAFITERDQHTWRRCRRPAAFPVKLVAVPVVKPDTATQEQHPRMILAVVLKPSRIGSRKHQPDPVPVFGKSSHPFLDRPSIWRVHPHDSVPLLRQSVVVHRVSICGTLPRLVQRLARVQIKRPHRFNDVPRSDPIMMIGCRVFVTCKTRTHNHVLHGSGGLPVS